MYLSSKNYLCHFKYFDCYMPSCIEFVSTWSTSTYIAYNLLHYMGLITATLLHF